MQTLGTTIRPANDESFREAAEILRDGGLVAFPTETVYGLGADATSDNATAGIFAAKDRPRFNPLIVHFTDSAAAAREVVFDTRAREIAARFWPGPLTLVLPRRADSRLSLLCSAGLDTQAVRVPAHPVAQRLLAEAGLPLAAPSANASGRISPTQAAHVARSLDGRIPLILDGGACSVGLESTVLDLSTPKPTILRPGAVTAEDLSGFLDLTPPPANDGTLKAPGMLSSHYAPAKPLRLEATSVAADEALLAFGPQAPSGAAVTLNLSPAGDLAEAATRLFACLRELDESDAGAIAAMPIPESGLGAAINDRLRRAAAPREG
ncbi:threonylcarbamoyl-AMP synthase [Pelagibius litoralis]|uniref:Threonylcarbamoyl-AMP synthase n=1 Tax=Pelagibius litoralis TaxID=374515 RepID=A0A967F0D7_9PROT|nr:L-threonylcarbamoyladenylate synthase [Pelagibius litoralis]NIA70775.1 threonylcarbamoyl-AMP synthase [Pelagibius litoralis]